MSSYLTDDQVQHFVENGYVVLHDAFDRDFAKRITARAWERTGFDPNDSTTWTESRVHLPAVERWDVREVAPDVWRAVCDLLGGEERVHVPYEFSDGLISNFSVGADEPWQSPEQLKKGWHKDGDFFRHFLDSPEQGLLTIVLWSDVVHQGGPTYIAPESVELMARYLAERPEGVHPGGPGGGFPVREMIDQCSTFVEATGEAGDVYLMHPYMLHSVSQNVLRRPRFISNPPVHLKEPMNFNREDPSTFSPVERAVLHGLGVERYDFQPTAPRERIESERAKRHKAQAEQERAKQAGH